MTCAIKDLYTGFYYTGNATANGYYHPILGRARLYRDQKMAYRHIAAGGHHVIWPGNRHLTVVNVKIEEIKCSS